MRPEQIIIRPIITEKADRLRELNCYQFIVAKKATKNAIKEAIEKLFNVEVLRVHTANFRGKLRRLGRSEGYRPGYKKASVWIKPGQKIEIIEGV
jgi:large subunit ribosomal protein L23|uniref:Large ribosomal subunit protein uL23 n=1 Tax=candidate division WOR-3 bacterium TaxID=2052148 RepID=A0A7V3VTX7_UNCW3